MKKNNDIFITVITFFCYFLFTAPLFAANANQKGNPPRQELKTAQFHNASRENTNDTLSKNDSPLQLAHYRQIKLNHWVKLFFIVFLGTAVSLDALKKTPKRAVCGFTRFIQLLLFPNHVFW